MITADPRKWAQENFGGCEFFDQRLSNRMVAMAEKAAMAPESSIPKMFGSWADTKAAYRFFDNDKVTHERVGEPHWKRTRSVTSGTYLIVSDTTDVDFGAKRQIRGVGPTNNKWGKGFFVHSGLMVDPRTRQVEGVAAQRIVYRKPAPEKETRKQRKERKRESEVLHQLVDDISTPAGTARFIHVIDRGGDDFELFCHFQATRTDWVVRACQLTRIIITPEGERRKLKEYLQEKSVRVGRYTLEVRKRGKRPARKAKMEVRRAEIYMPAPKFCSPYVKQLQPAPIRMSVVWAREINPPEGEKPVEWVLYTSLRVKSYQDAWTVLDYYECRWIVEDWHKVIKTGCQLQARQLRDALRLEPLVAWLSIVAVRLLKLREVGRTEPERPARTFVPLSWLKALAKLRPRIKKPEQLTAAQFIREVAMEGGFLGRKGDGQPGWITIWRGWERLQWVVVGYEGRASG